MARLIIVISQFYTIVICHTALIFFPNNHNIRYGNLNGVCCGSDSNIFQTLNMGFVLCSHDNSIQKSRDTLNAPAFGGGFALV